jgi:hypothetical protein
VVRCRHADPERVAAPLVGDFSLRPRDAESKQSMGAGGARCWFGGDDDACRGDC